MIEEEWLTCSAPQPLLEHLQGQVSERKLRLFGVACCRRISDLIIDDRSRAALEMAERFADGQAAPKELRQAAKEARIAADDRGMPEVAVLTVMSRSYRPALTAQEAAEAVRRDERAPHRPMIATTWEAVRNPTNYALKEKTISEQKGQVVLIRDIFGNPFRPVTTEPAWLTSTVVSLATAIYTDRAFDRLPILADALEDAGCTNEEILNHCRQPGEHVRGCWVVDLVLKKK